MSFLSEFHRKTFQKCIRFFSKQTFARYNEGSKVPSLLESGLQILLLFVVLGRFYNAGRFKSQVRSLINITDANIYDAIGVSVREASYEKITSIKVDFTFHYCLRLCAVRREHWRVGIQHMLANLKSHDFRHDEKE